MSNPSIFQDGSLGILISGDIDEITNWGESLLFYYIFSDPDGGLVGYGSIPPIWV
jgi:hypothetical protein